MMRHQQRRGFIRMDGGLKISLGACTGTAIAMYREGTVSAGSRRRQVEDDLGHISEPSLQPAGFAASRFSRMALARVSNSAASSVRSIFLSRSA